MTSQIEDFENEQDFHEVDPDTGDVTESAQEKIAKSEIRKIYDRQAMYKDLTDSPGWQLLMKEFQVEVDRCIESLKKAKDYREMLKIQAEVKALETLPFLIGKSFYDAAQVDKLIREADLPLDS